MYQWKNNNWIAALFFFFSCKQFIGFMDCMLFFFSGLNAIPGKFKVWMNMHMHLILIT